MKTPAEETNGNDIGSSMCPPARNDALIFTRTDKLKVDSKPGESLVCSVRSVDGRGFEFLTGRL